MSITDLLGLVSFSFRYIRAFVIGALCSESGLSELCCCFYLEVNLPEIFEFVWYHPPAFPSQGRVLCPWSGMVLELLLALHSCDLMLGEVL